MYSKNIQNCTQKQIISFKTTVNWLFNDVWCYLFIACFHWKIDVFQQTVVRVYYILNLNIPSRFLRLKFYLISLFHFIMRNYILAQHSWKVLDDLVFSKVWQYLDVWLFTENLNHFFEGIYCGQHINDLCWESNCLSIRPPRVL